MAVSRVGVVDAQFREYVLGVPAGDPRQDWDTPVVPGSRLTARLAGRLLEVQIASRTCDILSRELKTSGQSFYTIGSSGHEGNAALAAALRPDDPAFLHYRSGAFYIARAGQVPGVEGELDLLLGMVASADESIAGGRHKVFGSVRLAIPPQTSTIASQLPKALGCAVAIDRRARFRNQRDDRIVVCTFGDASANHSTAAGAINAAAWAGYQKLPAPVLFMCEDNGFGISVRTPRGWIRHAYEERPGLEYFHGNGLDLASAYDSAIAAVEYVRSTRRPAFLHLRTVRLLGHAGSDVEQLYRSRAEIEAAEADDPLRRSAAMLVQGGWLTAQDVLELYDETRERLGALAVEAVRRPKLTTAAQVMEPLFAHEPDTVAQAVPVASDEKRLEVFRGALPEAAGRKRHMAFQLNRALADLLAGHPDAVIFGEDVARKGGVYHVTAGLSDAFGVGRVFNTLLDEQTIMGMAIGAGHAGLLPIPEIQYLAYLMNAIDQLRGEAGSMRFFSNGQYSNPMVVRIAGLAYQKGFGGHFHNDNGIAPLLEIPGLLVGCPARGDDAVRMLRTMAASALAHGRVCVLLEPIALYMTKDLYEDGDAAWLSEYPAPHEHLPVGEIAVYGTGTDLCIATYANGLRMSLRVARRLATAGITTRVVDLRWLAPLPLDALAPHAEACGKLLVVDECRRNSGIASTVVAELTERVQGLQTARVTGEDSYIPLGAAADLVLVGEEAIEGAATALAAR